MNIPYFIKKPVVVVPLVALACFALFSPDSGLSSSSVLSWFVKTMSELFPPIAAYTRKSKFPNVTQAYMAFSFLLIPIHGWYSYKEINNPNNKAWHKDLWTIKPGWDFVKRMLLILILGSAAFITLFRETGYDFNLAPINSSRVALATFGWFLGGAGQAWVFTYVCLSFLAFFKFFKGKLNG
jgi:hypothetical protein